MIIPRYEIHVETKMCSLSYHDPLVEPLLSHSVRPTLFCIQMSSCFILGDAFWTLISYSVTDVDDRDCTFSNRWFDVILFFQPIVRSMHIPFWVRFTDLHGVARSSPLTRYTPRRGPVRYFIMILQWSPPWAIQSGPHFSAFGCHHTSPSEVRLFYPWVWFSYGFEWWGSRS